MTNVYILMCVLRMAGCIPAYGSGFKAQRCHGGAGLHLGCFVDKDDAARTIDRFLIYTVSHAH